MNQKRVAQNWKGNQDHQRKYVKMTEISKCLKIFSSMNLYHDK